MLDTALQIHIPYMREKSAFSSKKISKHRNTKKLITSKKSPNKSGNKKTDEIFSNQEIKQDLQSFYNNEAKKYAETRKKFWHEEKNILNAITPLFNHEKKIRVLEFWCWSGRFATLLNNNFEWQFDYIGIDLSEELIQFASKDNPDLTFIQWDITKLIWTFEQESFDLIVWTSSFQHIPTAKERSFLMKNFYRLLNYDWILLMTNRCLSSWFFKKNWKIVYKARILSWVKINKNIARDILVPRKDNTWKVYNRFYHFFSLNELEKLAVFAWLSIKTNKFMDENWELTDKEKTSRSSIFIATKSPIEW